jgi:hypothetical protein
MAWDRNFPLGSTPINQADNGIRDNWAYVRSAIAQEHADFDVHNTDPTQIVHLQGSARVISYNGMVELATSALVRDNVTELYHDSRDVGRIIVDNGGHTAPGRIWICSFTDIFTEAPRRLSTLVLAGPGTALNAQASIAANGGVVIPTLQTLRLPPGENSVTDGTTAFDLWAHAARHLINGDDALTGILAGNVVYKTGAGPISATGTMVTHTFDFSTRTGNSLILALGWLRAFENTLSGNETVGVKAWFELGDVQQGQAIDFPWIQGTNNDITNWSMPAFQPAAFLVPNASGQVVDWEFYLYATPTDPANGVGEARDFGMILIDVGTVGLTT